MTTYTDILVEQNWCTCTFCKYCGVTKSNLILLYKYYVLNYPEKKSYIYIIIYIYLSDNYGDGVVGYTPTKPHVAVLGPRCKMSQCDGQFQTRFEWCSEEGVLFGDAGAHSLQYLVKHFRWHPHEVYEGFGVFSSQLHHELVIKSKLSSSLWT